MEKKGRTGSKLKSSTKEENLKKPAVRQSSLTRKSSEKDKISEEQKRRSSRTGKVASGEAKHKTDEKVTRERKEKSSKNVEAIAEVGNKKGIT